MNTNIRKAVLVAVGAAAMGLASSAWAGLNGKLLEKAQERSEQQSAPPAQPQREQHSQPAPQPAPAPREHGSYRNGGSGQPAGAPPDHAPRPDRGARGGDNNEGGLLGGMIQRNYGTDDHRGDHDNRGGYRDGNRYDGRHYDNHRPPRVVNSLPYGYRSHYWNGSPYYYFGGSWYRPYGSSFVTIGAPYGLFVSSLPGYYNSFWFGSTRYYYADDTYYTYEPARRGYVVARSPYDNDRDADAGNARDEDLYIYPARGQSEKQQADDRYECHRWAVNEAHYDPIDADYDADRRADYLRAMTACLTGRGYSVR